MDDSAAIFEELTRQANAITRSRRILLSSVGDDVFSSAAPKDEVLTTNEQIAMADLAGTEIQDVAIATLTWDAGVGRHLKRVAGSRTLISVST